MKEKRVRDIKHAFICGRNEKNKGGSGGINSPPPPSRSRSLTSSSPRGKGGGGGEGNICSEFEVAPLSSLPSRPLEDPEEILLTAINYDMELHALPAPISSYMVQSCSSSFRPFFLSLQYALWAPFTHSHPISPSSLRQSGLSSQPQLFRGLGGEEEGPLSCLLTFLHNFRRFKIIPLRRRRKKKRGGGDDLTSFRVSFFFFR